ncbi:hypothetical protein ACFL47_08865 [Candidatus Latescibacterota bacterium]
MMSPVEIRPLPNTKKNMKSFVKFAWDIYQGDPNWVPPLINDQVDYICDGPYHDTGIIQPFMAYRDGVPVGRLIAHYDNRHNEHNNEKRGCIGFFECIDDNEISGGLFDAAESWLAGQGMEEMYGPLNYLVYDCSGLLIDNFDDIPVIECVYNPPYYERLFLDYGFTKAIDWYAYRFMRDTEIPKTIYRIRDRVLNNKEGIKFRDVRMDKKGYIEDVDNLMGIFNKAWENNWEHLPLSKRQFMFFANSLKMIVKPELIMIAEHEGKPIGYMLSVPDINQVLKKVNGRLFPFGIFHLIFGMKKVQRIKAFMLGVLPEYRHKGLDVFFFVETVERGKRMGYMEADCSVVVENNTAMINGLDHFGATRYKTYRHFSRPITG